MVLYDSLFAIVCLLRFFVPFGPTSITFLTKKNVHFSIIKSIAADAFFTVENFSKIEKDKDDEDESEENEKIQCVTVQ